MADPPVSASRGPVGVVEALWDGYLVAGWAADPRDRAARPLIRLMRGMEVLAEGEASQPREDGQPGFLLAAPVLLTPQDFLTGRVRVRALLPGRNAPTTLPMGAPMQAALEAMAADPQGAAEAQIQVGALPPEAAPPVAALPIAASVIVPPEFMTRSWPAEPPASEPARNPGPGRAAPVEAPWSRPASRPLVMPFTLRADVAPHWEAASSAAPPAPEVQPRPAPEVQPRPAPEVQKPAAPEVRKPPAPEVQKPPAPEVQKPPAPEMPPPLGAMLEIARHAATAGVPVLHLLVPRRASMPGGHPMPGLAALEAAAGRAPLLAQDWLPLRHAFARATNPAALWRQDGLRLSVEGSLAVLGTLLAVLRLRRPEAATVLDRAHRLVSRADVSALPRREIVGEAGSPSFLGVASPETEPALPADLFADQPEPRAVGEALPGLQAWRQPGAPLPWRVVVMAEPGLGGSTGPAQLGWWLRVLAAETVLSEALHLAAPAAVVAAQPDLLLTLAAEPEA
ncbi:hypothetical protein [Falsiroseomonas sp. E2-1-a20]|uniref:hypothetical protein n=1 Tax=Falsiroseomonas sp. E2-1-a20 TaxID=3239300 RepID=UPI003F338875